MSRVLLVSLVVFVSLVEVQSMALQDFCVYYGKRYEQGQTWMDGCKYNCTCVDASKGQYSCMGRCFQFPSLPSVCTMEPPQPGKCCMKPKCPSNIMINYPPGYVDA